MKIVKESPEHSFLTFIDKVKRDSGGWTAVRVALSRKLDHGDIIDRPDHISGKIFKFRKESEAIIDEFAEKLKSFTDGMAFLFSDGDIVFAVRVQNNANHEAVQAFCKELAAKVGAGLCEMNNLAKDIYAYQKLADERFLSSHRMKSYETMADISRLQSIPLRRQRREDPLILIVEDDRFTASYASNLLNKDFDVVHAKTGEEALTMYIEHAPDAVFLDIHLPGLDGHETLRALRRIDPESFIIMLSVDTVKQNIVDSTKFGAAGFLKKPFTKDRLIGTVQKSPFIKRFKLSSAPGSR